MSVQRGETSQLIEIIERIAEGGVQVDVPPPTGSSSSGREPPARDGPPEPEVPSERKE
jgi:hypothetical protein